MQEKAGELWRKETVKSDLKNIYGLYREYVLGTVDSLCNLVAGEDNSQLLRKKVQDHMEEILTRLADLKEYRS